MPISRIHMCFLEIEGPRDIFKNWEIVRAKVDSQKQSFMKKSVEMLAVDFEIAALSERNLVPFWHTLCRGFGITKGTISHHALSAVCISLL